MKRALAALLLCLGLAAAAAPARARGGLAFSSGGESRAALETLRERVELYVQVRSLAKVYGGGPTSRLHF
jgi:hypothetical protein